MFTYFVATLFFLLLPALFMPMATKCQMHQKKPQKPIELQIKFLNNIVFQYFNAT
jgi:hypothetical protein